MLRSTRFMTIALAFVFPLTVISAQQPCNSKDANKTGLKERPKSVPVAHKPVLLANNRVFTDAEINERIGSIAEKFTQKKIVSRTASNNAAVITPLNSYARNSYTGNVYMESHSPVEWIPVADELVLSNESSITFQIQAKSNTLYAMVIDYQNTSANTLYAGPDSFTSAGMANANLEKVSASQNSSGEFIYFFDAATQGDFYLDLFGNGTWNFTQAKLIATPLN